MKKLIMMSSLSLITVFAVLLANASDDTSPSESADQVSYKTGTTSEPKEQPGTAAEHADHWKTAKTCTDEAGVIHKRGQKGFSQCIESMRKKSHETHETHEISPKSTP